MRVLYSRCCRKAMNEEALMMDGEKAKYRCPACGTYTRPRMEKHWRLTVQKGIEKLCDDKHHRNLNTDVPLIQKAISEWTYWVAQMPDGEKKAKHERELVAVGKLLAQFERILEQGRFRSVITSDWRMTNKQLLKQS